MPPSTRKCKATSDAPVRPPPKPPAPNDTDPSDSTSSSSSNNNVDSDTPEYKKETDRSLIDKPVRALIVPAMSMAWEISQYYQMCILFDAVNPVRQFKRGTVFNEEEEDPYPKYNPCDGGDATESDEEATFKPYKPSDYLCVIYNHA